MSAIALFDRAYGCILGQAIGDALGAPVEGYKPSSIRQRYGRITDFLQDHPVGTDDTEYAVLNALILLEYGLDLSEADVYDAWQRWLMTPESGFRGGGFSDKIAMVNLRRGLMPPASGRFNQQMWSDGLAMAVGPVGVACAGDPGRAAQVAARLGATTNGRDGIHAGQAVAVAVAVAMTGASPGEMLAAALAHVPADSWTGRLLRRAADIAAGHAAIWSALDALHDGLAVTFFPWADIAPEAVALAFGAFLAARKNKMWSHQRLLKPLLVRSRRDPCHFHPITSSASTPASSARSSASTWAAPSRAGPTTASWPSSARSITTSTKDSRSP